MGASGLLAAILLAAPYVAQSGACLHYGPPYVSLEGRITSVRSVTSSGTPDNHWYVDTVAPVCISGAGGAWSVWRRGSRDRSWARGACPTWSSGPSTSPLDAMVRRLLASLIAVLVPTAFAGPWAPYDAHVERQHAVSAEAYKRIDFLTPSALFDSQQTLDCVVTYDVRPSFAPQRHWCLRRSGATYTLDSWE